MGLRIYKNADYGESARGVGAFIFANKHNVMIKNYLNKKILQI